MRLCGDMKREDHRQGLALLGLREPRCGTCSERASSRARAARTEGDKLQLICELVFGEKIARGFDIQGWPVMLGQTATDRVFSRKPGLRSSTMLVES